MRLLEIIGVPNSCQTSYKICQKVDKFLTTFYPFLKPHISVPKAGFTQRTLGQTPLVEWFLRQDVLILG